MRTMLHFFPIAQFTSPISLEVKFQRVRLTDLFFQIQKSRMDIALFCLIIQRYKSIIVYIIFKRKYCSLQNSIGKSVWYNSLFYCCGLMM